MVTFGELEVALIFAACSIATALIFRRKGRSGVAGFFIGLIFGPIGLGVALLLPPGSRERSAPSRSPGP